MIGFSLCPRLPLRPFLLSPSPPGEPGLPLADASPIICNPAAARPTPLKTCTDEEKRRTLNDELVRVVLCHVIILNRRRPGEMQFMESKHYFQALSLPATEESDVFQSLTEPEKQMARLRTSSRLLLDVRGYAVDLRLQEAIGINPS